MGNDRYVPYQKRLRSSENRYVVLLQTRKKDVMEWHLDNIIAGMGFSNVGLGIAHSMAHTLGAVYDTPHGVACA